MANEGARGLSGRRPAHEPIAYFSCISPRLMQASAMRTVMGIVFAVGLAILVATPQPAHASYDEISALDCTLYVSVSGGSDTNSGGYGAPFEHINHALSQAAAGDVVCVDGGIYRETVVFPNSGTDDDDAHRIILAADPSSATAAIIDGTIAELIDGQIEDYLPNQCICPAAVRIENQNHIRVSGFTIRNRGNVRYTECTGAQARQCTSKGVGILATTDDRVYDVVVDSCRFEGIASAFPQALGLPIAIAALAEDAFVIKVDIARNEFLEADTRAQWTDSENQVQVLESGHIAISGRVEDFFVNSNLFIDDDSMGINTSGNHAGGMSPSRGVITGNEFRMLDQSANYAVYLQATRQVLVERNYFVSVGRGVGVATEPPCDVYPYILSGHVWIRNNIFHGTQTNDFVTGAFANSTKCPEATEPLYLSTEDIWFTNNTLYRANDAQNAVHPSVLVVFAEGNGLIGDSIIQNNAFVGSGRFLDFYTDDYLSDYNAFSTVNSSIYLPFWENGTTYVFGDWRHRHDSNSWHVTTNFFSSPSIVDAFQLAGSSPLIDQGNAAPSANDSPARWPVALSDPFGEFEPAVELDFYGGTRSNGQRDLGADEY